MLSLFRLIMLGVVAVSVFAAGWLQAPILRVLFYTAMSLAVIWLAQSGDDLLRRVRRVRTAFAKDRTGIIVLFLVAVFVFYVLLPALIYGLGYGFHQLFKGLSC